VFFKKLLLNLYVWPCFLVVTIAGLFTLPFLFGINMLFWRRPLDSLVRKAVRIYGWVLVRVVPFMGPVEVEYRAGQLDLPVIFVANHRSSLDPYLFGALPYEMAFVTSWPFKIPVYNFIMRLARYIDATLGWEEIEEKGKELLSSGCSMIVWPEGHRSRDGRMGRFKNGAFRLAYRTGRNIVPVCICGTRQVLAPGKRFFTPGRIKLIVLPAISPRRDLDEASAIVDLKKRAMEAIKKGLAEFHGKHSTSSGPAGYEMELAS